MISQVRSFEPSFTNRTRLSGLILPAAARLSLIHISAVVEAARTNSAQAVSQVVGSVGNYVKTLDSAVAVVMEQLDGADEEHDAFLRAFLTARPEVAAITAYDENGTLLDCWAQDGRTPKESILRNLSFDLNTANRLGRGYKMCIRDRASPACLRICGPVTRRWYSGLSSLEK